MTRADPRGRREELEDALLLGEPTHEENVRWILGRPDPIRDEDSARHDAHVSGAQIARGVRERFRGTEDEPRTTQQSASHPLRP